MTFRKFLRLLLEDETASLCILFSLFFIGLVLYLSGCGETPSQCSLPTGTYARTYTQEYASGACSEFEREPQFTQAFVDGSPLDDDDACTVSADALTDDQCHMRLRWTCESTTDAGVPFTVEWTEIVSQHDGGAVLEGQRSIVLSVDGQTCDAGGHVLYEEL